MLGQRSVGQSSLPVSCFVSVTRNLLFSPTESQVPIAKLTVDGVAVVGTTIVGGTVVPNTGKLGLDGSWLWALHN